MKFEAGETLEQLMLSCGIMGWGFKKKVEPVSHFSLKPGSKIQGVLPYQEIRGARSSQVHQIRGKRGKFCYHKMQKVGKNPNSGVISETQGAKFGIFVTYIFGGKIWGSKKNFRGNFRGQPPRPLNMEVPPGL